MTDYTPIPPRVSAAVDLGPHLLGRVPRRKDPRDYEIGRLVNEAGVGLRDAAGSRLDVAASHVAASHLVPSVLKRWVAIATPLIDAATPAPAPPAPPAPPPPATGADVWELTTLLDQGQTPHCVGDGWAAWEAAAPVEEFVTQAQADAIYYACKVIDGQPKQEDGTDVRSGATVMLNAGRLSAYAFATSISDATAWLDDHGPIVFGSDWTDDMFNPEPGTGRVRPTGAVAGGHCWIGLGHIPKGSPGWPVAAAEPFILAQNSWGASWGAFLAGGAGRFVISVADMQALLSAQGDACVALELPL